MKLLIEGKCVCVLKGWGEGEKKRGRRGVGPGIQVINIILTKYSSKIRTSVFFLVHLSTNDLGLNSNHGSGSDKVMILHIRLRITRD